MRTPASLGSLRAATRAELEEQYVTRDPVEVPSGIFRGQLLMWLETPAATHPVLRPIEELMFARLAWWVDFDRQCWFWFDPRLAVGHFEPSVGPSRWRNGETIRFLYDDRRLPGFVNQFLYDEATPLSDELCLGLGGISAGRGRGEQFFFALQRVG